MLRSRSNRREPVGIALLDEARGDVGELDPTRRRDDRATPCPSPSSDDLPSMKSVVDGDVDAVARVVVERQQEEGRVELDAGRVLGVERLDHCIDRARSILSVRS